MPNWLLDVVGIRIQSILVAKSGRAEILELLFWKGIFEILAKPLINYDSLWYYGLIKPIMLWSAFLFWKNSYLTELYII